jgi:hypothetical protein
VTLVFDENVCGLGHEVAEILAVDLLLELVVMDTPPSPGHHVYR